MTDIETFYITHDPLDGLPIDPPPPILPPRRYRVILAEVAAAYGVTVPDLVGPRRYRHLIAPRREAMRRMKDELGYSYLRIGGIFNRTHATVIWALRGGRPAKFNASDWRAAA